MTQTLEQFAAACRAALLAENNKAGREKVCDLVKAACADPAFLDQYVVADAPERTLLYQDPDLGFCILAHSYVGAKGSNPHDHGPTWAIYGQGTGETIMTDYEMLTPATADVPGTVRPVKTYTLTPAWPISTNPANCMRRCAMPAPG